MPLIRVPLGGATPVALRIVGTKSWLPISASLEPGGMTRGQVAYIMGDPVFRNPFNDNRWDYIYSIEVPGYYEDKKRVSVFFENEVLAYFTGDLKSSEGDAENAEEPDEVEQTDEAEATVSGI